MTDAAANDVLRRLRRLPLGAITGRFEGRRYIAVKSTFGEGKCIKLVAEELGGADYISLNLYALASGARLFPCEMSRTKVTAFVAGFQPETGRA